MNAQELQEEEIRKYERWEAELWQAERDTTLCGVRIRAGELVAVYPRGDIQKEEGFGAGGVWGWGGCTSAFLKRYAAEIRTADYPFGERIWWNPRED